MNITKSFPFALLVTICGSGLVAANAVSKDSPASTVERGKYLVEFGGCNDCHTPMKMGEKGPEPDLSRMLSGHPKGAKLPPPPSLPTGPWAIVTAPLTAWSGPWGISYTANLTPDKTGLGD